MRLVPRAAWMGAALCCMCGLVRTAPAAEPAAFRLATFSADVTPRLGHPLLAGLHPPASSVDAPLFAKGLVLLGPDEPIVLVAVDWCEIRNDAYARWREALAEAAGTTPRHVLVTSVHQHDAPLADLTAGRLLAAAGVDEKLIDPDYHERTVRSVAKALSESLGKARRVTHYGTGQAKVERVASNRRVVDASGKAGFLRGSAGAAAAVRDLPEGLIDPWLKVVSFWDGETPVAAVSAYATHPMSYYGAGAVSSDFVGLARARRQQDAESVHQIYVSGASGDVTAGKYNDGTSEHRARLTERMHRAMAAAFEATERHRLDAVAFRSVPLVLPHRGGKQSAAALEATLGDKNESVKNRILAAMGLSSRKLHPAGHEIDVCAVDFGRAQIVLLPGESLVGYQLMAQKLRPDQFILTIGYGECSPGYIPTDAAAAEGYAESQGLCWVGPHVEGLMHEALEKALDVRASK
jgi:hypothetical protein